MMLQLSHPARAGKLSIISAYESKYVIHFCNSKWAMGLDHETKGFQLLLQENDVIKFPSVLSHSIRI